MYVFKTIYNNNVEMKNSINNSFAKTFELKLNLNIINIFNIVIIKLYCLYLTMKTF